MENGKGQHGVKCRVNLGGFMDTRGVGCNTVYC